MPRNGTVPHRLVGWLLIALCVAVLIGCVLGVWVRTSSGEEAVLSILGSWWLLVGLAVSLGLLLAGLMFLGISRDSGQSAPDVSSPAALVDATPDPAPAQVSVPLLDSQQPVTPREEAKGYGWMKASDLAGGGPAE